MSMSSIARELSKGIKLPLDRHSCRLLGPTALVVQGFMGVLAILSLVYKRQRETQKRPWEIWLFDVLKQVVGAMFIHGLNVLISDLTSYQSAGNACTYYFLNILLDTTLGVGLIYAVLHGTTWVLSKKLGIKGLKSGQYGNPPSFSCWIRQAAVYIFALTTMKLLVVALFAFWPGISALGDWLLSWTNLFNGESVQVIFVMGIFPLIMNIVQFWLIDSIVKASISPIAIRSITPRNSDSHDRQPLFDSGEDEDDVPHLDVEDGSKSTSARITSEGNSKTLVGREDTVTKLSASGPSLPMSLPGIAVVAAHDYPPNTIGSAPTQGSARSRHGYKRASSSLLDFPAGPSASTDSSGQAMLSVLLDVGQASTGEITEFGVREKVLQETALAKADNPSRAKSTSASGNPTAPS